VTSRAHVLLWTDSTAAYLDAIKTAGLADRVVLESLPRKEKPSADQMARTEALMAYAAPPGLLPAMPKLRWVQSMTAGVEGWLALPDLPANLTLTCARGTHREAMPENIIGALFHVAKPYAAAVENQKRGKWVPTMAQPLTGKTLGILGLGAIGQDVARIAAVLGMRVIGTRRRPEPMANVAEVLPPERTREVLAQSDFVLVLLPATPETDNFIDTERLGMMKPGAWLLNFGRGHVLKDDDLVAAVKAKKIAGAMLDVYEEYRLAPGHALFSLDNVILTPHLAAVTRESRGRASVAAAEEMLRMLAGENPRNFVNPEAAKR